MGPVSAETRLTSLVVGTRSQRLATAAEVRSLAAAVDFERLWDHLVTQRLELIACTRILEIAGPAAADALRPRLAEALVAARVRSRVQELAALQVRSVLEAAGIPAVLLKGVALARALYPEPALRPSGDIDVLVAPDDLTPAVRTISQLGWEPEPLPVPDQLPVLHRVLRRSGMSDVELHWRVHWYEEDFSRLALERATVNAAGDRTLQPADELACLLLYYARDGLSGLRQVADIAAWWDLHGRPQGPALERIAADHPALRPALSAAAVAVERLVGIPYHAILPSGSRATGWRALTAQRLVNPGLVGDHQQIVANAILVDALLTPTAQLGVTLRRQLFLDGDELARRRGVERSDSSVARSLARVQHVCVVLARTFWALVAAKRTS